MRHRKHNHLLGVKTAHRTSLIANLSCSLIDNGRIKTTLAKARALRPAIEKAITLAKKARSTEDNAKKVHLRRQAIARLRSKSAVKKLFDELVEQFDGRNGGYTRIYKLAIPRLGDAAEMAIIEFVEQLEKKKPKKKRTSKKSKTKESKPSVDSQEDVKDKTSQEKAVDTKSSTDSESNKGSNEGKAKESTLPDANASTDSISEEENKTEDSDGDTKDKKSEDS